MVSKATSTKTRSGRLLLTALLLLAGAVLTPPGVLAQDRLVHSVGGRVVDSRSGEPLQGVAVYIPGSSFATVTNADGVFLLKSTRAVRSVGFSCLGYGTRRIDVEPGKGSSMEVELSPTTLTLQEAVIFADDPALILSEALKRIPVNYPDEEELYETFYRETVQKRGRYIYISEAVSDMYKTSYREDADRDRIAVRKSRLLVSPKKSDTLGVKVLGGPAQAIWLDIVKNPEFLFNEKELAHYDLKMDPPSSVGDRVQYAVRIIPAESVDYALQTGVIYIDKQTLAISRAELYLDMSDKRKATEMMLVHRPAGLRFKPYELSVVVDYKYTPEDGRWRFNYLRTGFKFTCDWRKKLFKTPFTAVNEMVSTYRYPREQVVSPKRKESFSRWTTLYDKTFLYLDPGFWKDYNIIEPTVSLEKAVDRLRRTTPPANDKP